MFRPKREEEIKGRRRLDLEHLHGFHALPNIIQAINSRIIGLVQHMAQTRRTEMHTLFW